MTKFSIFYKLIGRFGFSEKEAWELIHYNFDGAVEICNG